MRSMHITLVVDASEGANLYGILEGRLSGVQVRFHHRPLVDAEQSEMTISATVSGEVPALLGFLRWIISKVGKMGGTLKVDGLTLVDGGECWEDLIDMLRILGNFWMLIGLSRSSGGGGELRGEDGDEDAEGCTGAGRRLRKVFRKLVNG